MKVAIAVDGEQVSPHFGHCQEFRVFEIEGNNIVRRYTLENPQHVPGFLPGFLAGKAVEIVIAGGIGSRAQDLFAERGIRLISGVSGRPEDVIMKYLQGTLDTGPNRCDH